MKLRNLISLFVVLVFAGMASAVEIKVDFGGGGVLDASWTQWNATSGNLTVDTVEFTLSNSFQPNGPTIRTGIGDALTKETLGSDDPGPGGVYTLEVTNLAAGAYEIATYFNNPTSYGDPWPGGGGQGVSVDGTPLAGPSPASYNETSENALVLSVSFASEGLSDVITIDWTNNATPSNWINGFELTPEPSTLVLLALGGLLLRRRR